MILFLFFLWLYIPFFYKTFAINNKYGGTIRNYYKIIKISPGGYKGFYQLGICKFIKENYNLDNFVFSGSSAGSWLSLFMCYKGFDFDIFEKKIINKPAFETKTVADLEKTIKNNILENYSNGDFHLDRLFIGSTTSTLGGFFVGNHPDNEMTISGSPCLKATIFFGFSSLEDAIDACISSSHVPFICGKIFHFYRNKLSFDGGFSGNAAFLPDDNADVFHIFPNIFIKKKFGLSRIFSFMTLFSRDKFDFEKEIKNGYADAKTNRDYLDSFFYV